MIFSGKRGDLVFRIQQLHSRRLVQQGFFVHCSVTPTVFLFLFIRGCDPPTSFCPLVYVRIEISRGWRPPPFLWVCLLNDFRLPSDWRCPFSPSYGLVQGKGFWILVSRMDCNLDPVLLSPMETSDRGPIDSGSFFIIIRCKRPPRACISFGGDSGSTCFFWISSVNLSLWLFLGDRLVWVGFVFCCDRLKV